jgi:anthranilate/para-aminobenzoate synthase component II
MWMRVEWSDGFVRWINLAHATDITVDEKRIEAVVYSGQDDLLALSPGPHAPSSIRLIQDESAALALLWRDLNRLFQMEAQG